MSPDAAHGQPPEVTFIRYGLQASYLIKCKVSQTGVSSPTPRHGYFYLGGVFPAYPLGLTIGQPNLELGLRCLGLTCLLITSAH